MTRVGLGRRPALGAAWLLPLLLAIGWPFSGALAVAPDFEAALARRVQDQAHLPLAAMDLPDVERLSVHEGLRHPRELELFEGGEFTAHLSWMDRPYHVFRFGLFHILTRSLDAADKEHLRWVTRALFLLQHRYPSIHRRLFEDLRTPDPQHLEQARQATRDRWVNSNKANLIVLDRSHEDMAIASNVYSLGEKSEIGGVTHFRNVAITMINPWKITGEGARLVYGLESDEQNYRAYMSDGLLETLVHEALHSYISARFNVDPLLSFVRRNPGVESYLVEEPMVNRTSLDLFEAAGGLSPVVHRFYGRIFQGLQHRNLVETGRLAEVAGALARLRAAPIPGSEQPSFIDDTLRGGRAYRSLFRLELPRVGTVEQP